MKRNQPVDNIELFKYDKNVLNKEEIKKSTSTHTMKRFPVHL